jgi:opacity protein-like surface antigen
VAFNGALDAGGRVWDSRGGLGLTNSINGMKIAGVVLAVAVGAAAVTLASAQVRVFMGPGGNNNTQGQGSAGLGTAGLGVGGFGSATDIMREPDPAGSNQGLNFGGNNFGANNALGVTGGAGGSGAGSTSQGSLSSAIDRPSSPINSVTNSLMGPVGIAVSSAKATKPAAKPKQKAAAVSPGSNSAATDAKETPPKNP